MRSDCKLILVEGLCGTGKSTSAERLQRHLVEQGIPSGFYDEGAKEHPASLNWHAFYREEEYDDLIHRYPNIAEAIRSRAIKDGGQYLIPYRHLEGISKVSELYAELKSRELCWTKSPVASMAEYTFSIQQQWARFAELASNSETVFVLEAVFLQHQIHDLLRHYKATDSEIELHIRGIAEQIAALNPVLIYLTQPSVREQQVWISSVRSKPNWATEDNIRFMENRKRIELGLLDRLPFSAYTIENADLDWEQVFRAMVGLVGVLHEKKSERVEMVRELVVRVLRTPENSMTNQEITMMVYLSGVSDFASKLAVRRGENSEIAAIAGLMHNYYLIKTGITSFPGPNSADAARPILRETQLFSNEEMSAILRAIFYQDDRQLVHGTYEEIIKDAIVVQKYIQTSNYITDIDRDRLNNVLDELGISAADYAEVEACIVDKGSGSHQIDEDRRLRLADCAEELAGQNIMGVPEDERYRTICKYWPDSDDIHKVLEGKWCAAFVYYCCMQVGIELPIRYPNMGYRLAGVGAWLDWARLPETGFFHLDGQDEFVPERGDLVVYDKLLSDDAHDHIGVVLSCVDDKLLVAEGNKDNQNYSSVVHRDRAHCILGYIRIANSYRYQFEGKYQPISGVLV